MAVRRRLAIAAVVAVSALIAGCAKEPASAPPSRALSSAVSAELDTAISAALRAAKAPGVLVGVWSPEGDYVKAFGEANTASGIPMKADFYSRIGSVTKTFTATAVLQLVDSGDVGLDDPIDRYVSPGRPGR